MSILGSSGVTSTAISFFNRADNVTRKKKPSTIGNDLAVIIEEGEE